MRRELHYKKGVGTALGTAFFIIVVITSVAAIWTLGNYEARYREVRDKMTDWDIERQSEDLTITDIENLAPSGYNFTLTVNNLGGTFISTARIYVYDQANNGLAIYDPQNGTSNGFVSGTVNVGEKEHEIVVKGNPLVSAHSYRVILTTDRGRQFSYSYPPPPAPGGGGGGFSLVIADDSENFQYSNENSATFRQAFVKSAKCTNNLYRVLLNNTTNKKIEFHKNSSFLQMAGKVGQVIPRYIVANSSRSYASPYLVPFSYQVINPGASQYVYFAAETPGGTTWQPEASQTYWLVSLLLYWKYEGETEIRNISTPAIAQELTSKSCP